MRAIVTTSWDDGDALDLKLADMLSERGISGTFYASPRNRERPVMGKDELRRLAEGFEIGAHSLTHPDLRPLSGPNLMAELLDGRRDLEDTLDRPVDMFCYPKGRYTARVRRAVIECGFIGARTTRMFRFDLPADPYLMPATIAVRNCPWTAWVPHCIRTLSWAGLRQVMLKGRGKPWRELAIGLFEHVLEKGGVWHLWGHSWEIEERGMWDGFRAVLDAVSDHDEVAYLTNGALSGGRRPRRRLPHPAPAPCRRRP